MSEQEEIEAPSIKITQLGTDKKLKKSKNEHMISVTHQIPSANDEDSFVSFQKNSVDSSYQSSDKKISTSKFDDIKDESPRDTFNVRTLFKRVIKTIVYFIGIG